MLNDYMTFMGMCPVIPSIQSSFSISFSLSCSFRKFQIWVKTYTYRKMDLESERQFKLWDQTVGFTERMAPYELHDLGQIANPSSWFLHL